MRNERQAVLAILDANTPPDVALAGGELQPCVEHGPKAFSPLGALRSEWHVALRYAPGSTFPYQPSLRSSQVGFFDAINASFFSLSHPLICFSR